MTRSAKRQSLFWNNREDIGEKSEMPASQLKVEKLHCLPETSQQYKSLNPQSSCTPTHPLLHTAPPTPQSQPHGSPHTLFAPPNPLLSRGRRPPVGPCEGVARTCGGETGVSPSPTCPTCHDEPAVGTPVDLLFLEQWMNQQWELLLIY